VDDLHKNGAAFLGTAELVSPCFYMFSSMDISAGRESLSKIDDLQSRTEYDPEEYIERYIRAGLRSAISFKPYAKKNSCAPFTMPCLVVVVIRDGDTSVNLSNSFSKPVVATKEFDLQEAAVRALDEGWRKSLKFIDGSTGVKGVFAFNPEEYQLNALEEHQVKTESELIEAVLNVVR
jgi:hypothetical protein